MAEMGRLTWPVKRRNDFLRIISYIALATAFIFIFDILTPLGLVNWILYLVPLFLTVYLSWKYAPFVMTGVFIFLMAVSLFLSPRDVSLELALLNRIFFAIILIIASFFIRDYVANVEGLTRSEERYRSLIEWLPEGIFVCQEGVIVYVNPAGVRMLGVRGTEDLLGTEIIKKIDSEFWTLFEERLAQAAIGAEVDVNMVRLIRQDGSSITAGVSLKAILWDRQNAVQIVMKSG
jgi:PAS domain S-box-containing protein